jgi:predicted alpha/beta hydrolase family esterase
VPPLPDGDNPDLNKWLPFILEKGEFSSDTILIGHSAGSPLILSILENIKIMVDKAILVSGYARPKGKKREAELILQEKYNWGIIKSNVKDLFIINSNDDPWGCNHEEGLYMWNNLGGTLILRSGEGHMGSDVFN